MDETAERAGSAAGVRTGARDRLAALTRINAALARLRDCPDATTLIPAAAEELAVTCDFERTVVSRLRGSHWRAEAVWFAPYLDREVSAATRAYLTQSWIPLSSGRLETDLVRRRVAAVVGAGDPRTTEPLMRVSRSPGYAAAPILPTGRVIGFLQADCVGSARPLTEHDRDNLMSFAEGLGLLYHRVVLLERLRTQRSQAREAFAQAEAQLAAMAEDEVRLTRDPPPPHAVADRAAELLRPAPGHGLTSREREVAELMTTGATNSEIADRLVIGPETVKTHLRGVLRKLDAATRAEAVARYLQLQERS